MTKLPKRTLSYNKKKDTWDLRKDKSKELVKSFPTKEKATKGGVLPRALGPQGGSVKIKKMDGTIQEERTFPGSRDPKGSPG